MSSEMIHKVLNNFSGRVMALASYCLQFDLGKMCMFLGLLSLPVRCALKTYPHAYCPAQTLTALVCGLLPEGRKPQVEMFDCFIREYW